MRLFVERGVAETSIRDIAQAASVAEGALYRHFAGKNDLVWRLFHQGYASFAATLDALQRQETGLRAKIGAMVGGFCRLFDADPVLFRFLLLVQHGQLAKLTDEMPSPVIVVRTVIARAIAEGELPAGDADLLTAMVMGIVLQTATFKIYGRVTAELRALAGSLSEACFAVLTAGSSESQGAS